MSAVCVVGLGKIGLPLACSIAAAGHRVRGADTSQTVVDQVNNAEEPFPGESGLADALRHVVDAGTLVATVDTTNAVAESEVVVVVVPLIVNESAEPDFGIMDAATRDVAAGLKPGTLVSYETTLPVGTTRNRLARALASGSGLTLGADLFVVHSPERVFSGRIFADLRSYPKLVGGIDGQSSARGVSFYESFLEFDTRDDLAEPNGVWDLGTAEAAELAKLAETTYRDLNIAYANELAIASEGIGVDVNAVIDACNSQPYSHIHRPGISVGGHCIPVYPHFLLNSTTGMSLPSAARAVNDSMPSIAADRLAAELGGLEGLIVVVLGLAYRGEVKEHAFSGTFALVSALETLGASVAVHDVLYEPREIESLGFSVYRRGEAADAAVLHTDHAEYLEWESADIPGGKVVYDGRNVLDADRWPAVLSLGRS
ncbi:nucleotide sugar dehydrogenase [Actinospongicola halichondriae]|uniref:nucleotide sugar dehydrogenase n=1 Tax=Actinospongicola halichondriae TaxID=3236844 RepID=UPI003D3DEEF4